MSGIVPDLRSAKEVLESNLFGIENEIAAERRRIANAESDIEYATEQLAKIEAIRDEHQAALKRLKSGKADAGTITAKLSLDTSAFDEQVAAAKATIQALKGGVL